MKNLTIKNQKQVIENIIALAWEEIHSQEYHNKNGGEFPAEQNAEELSTIEPLLKAAPEMYKALHEALLFIDSLEITHSTTQLQNKKIMQNKIMRVLKSSYYTE